MHEQLCSPNLTEGVCVCVWIEPFEVCWLVNWAVHSLTPWHSSLTFHWRPCLHVSTLPTLRSFLALESSWRSAKWWHSGWPLYAHAAPPSLYSPYNYFPRVTLLNLISPYYNCFMLFHAFLWAIWCYQMWFPCDSAGDPQPLQAPSSSIASINSWSSARRCTCSVTSWPCNAKQHGITRFT